MDTRSACMYLILLSAAGMVAGDRTSESTVPRWGKCYGEGMSSVLKCEDEDQCVYKDEFYSQCLPKEDGLSKWENSKVLEYTGENEDPIKKPPSKSETEDDSSTEENIVARWEQCAGKGIVGILKCEEGDICIYKNQFFSQCRPKLAEFPEDWTNATALEYSGHTIPGHTASIPASDLQTQSKPEDEYVPCLSECASSGGQCGGPPTDGVQECCDENVQCIRMSPFFAQCLPNDIPLFSHWSVLKCTPENDKATFQTVAAALPMDEDDDDATAATNEPTAQVKQMEALGTPLPTSTVDNAGATSATPPSNPPPQSSQPPSASPDTPSDTNPSQAGVRISSSEPPVATPDAAPEPSMLNIQGSTMIASAVATGTAQDPLEAPAPVTTPKPSETPAPVPDPIEPPVATPELSEAPVLVPGPSEAPVAIPKPVRAPVDTPPVVFIPVSELPIPAPMPAPMGAPTPQPSPMLEPPSGPEKNPGECSPPTNMFDITYEGELTYYGGAGSGGSCTQTHVPPGFTTVAINDEQYADGRMCGSCLHACFINEETSGRLRCFNAIVDNICYECAPGDLDLGESGSGRWPVDWTEIPCPLRDPGVLVTTQGSNPFYAKVKIEGGPTGVQNVSCQGRDGQGTIDGYWVFEDSTGSMGCGMECDVEFRNGLKVDVWVDASLLGGSAGC